MPLYPVRTTTQSFSNRHGIRLNADVYTPEGEGKFPVLVMRQPYGRAIASTVVYAHPCWYAAHGYIIVVQDVTGRGTSSGDFHPFAQEIGDGYDTVQWAAHLPQSDGQVGMYGFSYQGMTQLYAAQTQPPALKTICPAMVAADLYSGWFYENGAFCLQANLTWALQLGAETARRYQDVKAFQALRAAAQAPPFEQMSPELRTWLKRYAPFYFEWWAHPTPDDYWRSRNPDLTKISPELPMLHVGGWFDPYLRGTLDLYQQIKSQSNAPQFLLVGPWGHLPWGRRTGAQNYGWAAQNPIDQLQLRWFDYWLKGIDTDLLGNAPVSVFMLGVNDWRSLSDWPPTTTDLTYALSSNGLASTREDAGQLRDDPLEDPSLPDVLVHDPWRPVPSLGGHAALPSGVFERSHLDTRTDVLTYTTAPLEQEIELCGVVTVSLHCESSHGMADLAVTLSRVTPDGSVYPITQSYGHFTSLTEPIQLPLQACCVAIAAQNRLRLSLSGASFPAYPVPLNPHATEGNSLVAPILTLHIHSGTATPGTLRLPLYDPSSPQ